MREFIDTLKELFLLKHEAGAVGLTSFRKQPAQVVVPVKKTVKEVKISDLMRKV
jgi:hypothetical protein